MRYVDFVIQVDSKSDDRYSVRVVSSPAGGGAGTLVLPAELDDSVHPTPKKIGEQLFNALFRGEVRDLYERSQGELGRESGSPAGLRIVIKHNPRDAALARFLTVPWELLCNDQTGDFLSLGLHTPITRSLDVPRPPTVPPALPLTLRILVVVSRLDGDRELDLQRDVAGLRAGWKELRGCDVEILENPSRETVYRRLRHDEFHVLHSMSHGEFESSDGEGAAILGQDFAHELESFPSLRLAFLNACDSDRIAERERPGSQVRVAAALVRGGLPAVVAMQFPISDEAAIVFSKQLYDQVAQGEPLERAVAEGRLSLHRHQPHSIEWAAPVLFQHGQGGILFAATPASHPVARWVRRRGAASIGVLACLGLVSWGNQQQLPAYAVASYQDLRRSIETRASLRGDPRVEDLYDDGVHHLERWEYQAAADSLSRVLEMAPGSALAHLQIVTAWRGLGDRARATQAMENTRRLAMHLPRWARDELSALENRNKGDLGAAAEIYAELFETYPYNITYGLRLIDYRLAEGNLTDAASTITALIEIPWASRDPRVGIFAADVFYEAGNLREAADWAGRSAQQAQLWGARVLQASALLAEARALQDMRRYDQDLDRVMEAERLFADLGDTFGLNMAKELIAYHYLETGELGFAQEALTAWLQVCEENDDELGAGRARIGLGEILRLKGEYRRAIDGHLRQAERALQDGDPIGAADARLQIGSAHFGLGELDVASRYYTEVLNDFSGWPESKQVASQAPTSLRCPI